MADRLIRFSLKYPYLVLLPIIAVTLYFALQAAGIAIETDISSMIPSTEQESSFVQEYGRVQRDFDYFVLVISSDDLYRQDGLHTFHEVIKAIQEMEIFGTAISPFGFSTFEAVGIRIRPVLPSPLGRSPQGEDEITYFREKLEQDPFARRMVISEDGKSLAVFFHQPKKAADLEGAMDKLEAAIEPLYAYYDVHYIGTIPYALQTQEYLTGDLLLLLILASLFMVILFYIGFRALRAVLLPLLVAGIGLIWSMGAMALLGYPITVISVSLPPVILALGSSYTIHMLNQYMRDASHRNAEEGIYWMADGIRKIAATIAIAGLTTLIGFSSLLFSRIEQIKQFGTGAIAGILTCVILSLTFLPAALSLFPPPKESSSIRVTHGVLSRLMDRTGAHVLRRYRVYVILSAVLLVLCVVLYGRIGQKTDYLAYYPEDDPVMINTTYVLEQIGSFQYIYITLTAPEMKKDYFLDPAVLQQIYAYEQKIASLENVWYHSSFPGYVAFMNKLISGNEEIPDSRGLMLSVSRIFKLATLHNIEGVSSFANDDYSEITLILRVYDHSTGLNLYDEDLKELLFTMQELESMLPRDAQTAYWGWSLRFADLADILREDQNTSLMASAVGVAAVSMIFFKSMLIGLAALIPLAIGLFITYISMALFSIPLDMSSVMMASIAVGVGIDDAIHFLINYRRLRKMQIRVSEAVIQTISVTGRPIILTSLAIVGGLLILVAASFKPVMFFGLLISLALTGACLGTVLILPSWLLAGDALKQRLGRRP